MALTYLKTSDVQKKIDRIKQMGGNARFKLVGGSQLHGQYWNLYIDRINPKTNRPQKNFKILSYVGLNEVSSELDKLIATARDPSLQSHRWYKTTNRLLLKNRKKKVIRRKRRSKAERRVMKIKRGLLKRAKKLRLGVKRTGAYVYGTLRKIVGNPASPRSLAKLMALEKDGTTRYSSAYLMSAKNAFDRGQGAELHRLILTRMRKERGRDVDMRRLAENPIRSSFDKPTFGPFNTETRRVDTTTMAGMREAERLHRAGWYQGPVTLFSTTYYRQRALPKSSIARQIRGNPFRVAGYLRETPEEAGYRVIRSKGKELILEDKSNGKRELWMKSPNFAGAAIYYKGTTYEFASSAIQNNPMEYDVLSDKYIVTGSPYRDRMKALLTHIYAMRDAGKSQAAMKPFIKEYKNLKRIVTPLRSNPRTHGLSLKQMMKLYRMVSRGNPRAVKFAKSILGIPSSESLSQVKAVVYHHVLDLKGKR
jgi:hypothetical protein